MEIVRENARITPMITEHWKNKFEKAIRILLKSGHRLEDLIQKINEIALIEHEKDN